MLSYEIDKLKRGWALHPLPAHTPAQQQKPRVHQASAARSAGRALDTCSALASAAMHSFSATAARSTTPAMLMKPWSWPAHRRRAPVVRTGHSSACRAHARLALDLAAPYFCCAPYLPTPPSSHLRHSGFCVATAALLRGRAPS